jgi:CHAT domain-containing protein/tetratricopeptide (TPR) repeat protein
MRAATSCRIACLLLLALLPVAEGRAQTAVLHRGSSVTREIVPGETHLFELDVEAGQLVTASVFAGDLNYLLRLSEPDGDISQEVVHRRFDDLSWQVVAAESGHHRLAITSLESGGRSRPYQLKLEQVRPATLHEREAAAAAADFQRAEALRFGTHSADLLQASEKYRAAGDAWGRLTRWGEACVAWQRLGELHFVQGDYRKALRAYEEALRLGEMSSDPFLAVTQLDNIGYVQVYLGNIDKASGYFSQVRARLTKISVGQTSTRRRTEAQLENNFGEAEYARGNLKSSLGFFARARATWEEVGDRRGVALARLNASYSYFDSGSVNEAGAEIEESLRLWREVGDWRGEALTMTARGNLQALLGDRYAALDSHRTARDIFRRMGDMQGEAVASNGLADVYEDLNLMRDAVDNYELALRLNKEIGNKDNEAVGNYYLGRVHREAGDFTPALRHYEACLALSRRSGKLRMAAHALLDIAAIYTAQRKYEEALRLYRRSQDFYTQIGDLRRCALTHHGLGELRRARGELESAAGEYRQGLELFQRIRDKQGEAESRYRLASLLREQGRLPEALSESEKSVALVEDQRTRALGQNWRTTYFASVHRHFELYVDILMRLHAQSPERGYAALALEASERAKARTLLDLLAETRSEVPRGIDPALLARERLLRQQLSAKTAYQIQAFNSARPEVAEIETELRQLNAEYDFVQAQIKAQSPAYAQLTAPYVLGADGIRATLREDEGTVLLEYLVGEERSYLWFVKSDGLTARELPGRAALKSLAGDVYQSLVARQQRVGEDEGRRYERYTSEEAQFCSRAAELSRQVLAPLAGEGEARRLLVVPDGDLRYIPFDALPLPGGTGQCRLGAEPATYLPMLTRYEVVQLPSVSSLALLRRLEAASPPPDAGIAIWADPVFESDDPRVNERASTAAPHARTTVGPAAFGADPAAPTLYEAHAAPPTRLLATGQEADSIMRLAPAGAAVLLTGFAADRESALEHDLKGYRILHFATHGMMDKEHPSLSGLLLSTVDEQGQSRNGLLQLRDIYGLRLNANLVVLSACQTGLGEEMPGEGFVGLTQGFLYAGSRSVVVSLWQVEDKAAATLMGNFYEGMLREGVAPAVALRRAKLEMYRQGALQAPYFWSAFVIQGEFRTPPANRRDTLTRRHLWLAALAVAVLLSAYYGKRRWA